MPGRRIPRNPTKVTDEAMVIALARACIERGVPAVAAVPLAAQVHRESNLLIEGMGETGDVLDVGCLAYAKAFPDDGYTGPWVERHATEWLTTAQKDRALALGGNRTDAGGQPGGKDTGPDVYVSGTRDELGRWYVQLWPGHPWARFRSSGARGMVDKLHAPHYREALAAAGRGDAVAYVREVVAAGWAGEPLGSYRRGYDEAVPRMRAVYDRTIAAPYATALGDVYVREHDGPPLADWGKHWAQGGIFGWRRNATGATRYQPFQAAHQTYNQRDYGTTTIGAWDDGCTAPATGDMVRVPSGAWLSGLPLWDRRTGLPARLGGIEAARWLADHNGRLPAVAELRELEALSPFLAPVVLPGEAPAGMLRGERPGDPDMSDLEWCLVHDVLVIERARAAGVVLGLGGGDQKPGSVAVVAENPNDSTTAPRVNGGDQGAPGARATLRLGARGSDVADLQRAIGVAADGVFGPATLQRLRSWQAARGLVPDGVAGPATWRAIASPGPERPTSSAPGPVEPTTAAAWLASLPYRAARLQFPLPPGGLTQIMIHTAEVAPRRGAAVQLAADAAVTERASWHYSVDDGGAVCSVRLDRAAGGARGARHCVHVEMGTRIARQIAGRWVPAPPDWTDPYHTGLLAQTRQLVHALADVLGIPLRRLSLEEVLAGERGVGGHGDHTEAAREAERRGLRVLPWYSPTSWPDTGGWARGDHTDPGAFPWSAIL